MIQCFLLAMKYRQPAWGWSLILLSTLLLSPAVASVILHALAQDAIIIPVHVRASPKTATILIEPTDSSEDSEEQTQELAILLPVCTMVAFAEFVPQSTVFAPRLFCFHEAAIRLRSPRAPPIFA